MYLKIYEPESVMATSLFDYAETALMDGKGGKYYEPPLSFSGLAKSYYANATHTSCIEFKRDAVLLSVKLDNLINYETAENFITDRIVFDNAFLLKVKNKLGQVVGFKHLPAINMRRCDKTGQYAYITEKEEIWYRADSVFHLKGYDPTQEIYGIPAYYSALNSIWLNEDATLFRRKYYTNGGHTGYLLYLNNPNLSDAQEDEIRRKLDSTKGLGNFKNLFINGGGKDVEKPDLIPITQLNAKDEFANIKEKTQQDILTIHRIPLVLMSVIVEGLASVGDLTKVDKIFWKNQIKPQIRKLQAMNKWAGVELFTAEKFTSLDDL